MTYKSALGLVWTWYRPVAETCTRQHTTFIRDRHPCGIRILNPRKRAVAGLRLRPRDPGFVMDTVALGLRFLLVLVFLCHSQSISAPYSCITGVVKSYKLTASLNNTPKRKSLPLVLVRFQTNLCTLRILFLFHPL